MWLDSETASWVFFGFLIKTILNLAVYRADIKNAFTFFILARFWRFFDFFLIFQRFQKLKNATEVAYKY